MKNITFSGWKLAAVQPYQPIYAPVFAEGYLAPGTTPWIEASVPGSVYRDLFAAGLIEDPYYGDNSLKCEWVANRWWVYRTTFSLEKEDMADVLKLAFAGIDYAAMIYVNGTLIGEHEGMYIPFEAVVNDFVKEGENTLVCVLKNAPDADPQGGFTSKTRYLKARFNYKWDFCTRLVDLGLYGDVTLKAYDTAAITASFARPVKTESGWKLFAQLELDGYVETEATAVYRLEIQMEEGVRTLTVQKPFSLKKDYNTICHEIDLAEAGIVPKLWWPNGYGEQALHDVTFLVTAGDRTADSVSHRIGFRTIEYRHADGREDALPYLFVINGKRIYLKGTNMVPLDCMAGLSEEEVRQKLTDVRDANVNYLRIWGGGHIESEAYYRCCDELGLMILQEFTMSSSGCDDAPSKNPVFVEMLHRAAVAQMKIKRNHVSLSLIDGGNELTDEKYLGRPDHEGHPATFEDSTLAMLKGVCEAVCPDIMMLPASATGPNALLQKGDLGNNHDVHGPWGYMGVEEHYSLYNESDSIVHGEFGCGGISGLSALEKILPTEELRLTTSHESALWAHHSGGWDSYNGRERLMFGDLRGIDFTDYIKVNQFVQAESLRYSLEANRRRQWKNVGEMTWQFNEPWPNLQCSNVLEFYGGKKLAYYFVREAYAPVLASLRYHKLFYVAGDRFEATLHLINDRSDAPYQVTCTVRRDDGKLLWEETYAGTAKEDVSFELGKISLVLPEDMTGSFSVCIKTSCGDFNGEKEYLMLIADQDIPVEKTQLERYLDQAFAGKRKGRPEDFTRKRADWRAVAAYVDRVKAALAKK